MKVVCLEVAILKIVCVIYRPEKLCQSIFLFRAFVLSLVSCENFIGIDPEVPDGWGGTTLSRCY